MMGMKRMFSVMSLVVGMAGLGLAEPETPRVEVEVFPNQEDAMLRKLMAEMMKEAEQDRKEMQAPVELPQLDAPELQRLLRGAGMVVGQREQRWTFGVRLVPGGGGRIVVSQVLPGSPAAKAGLKVADALLDVNGIRLRDYAMLVELVQLVRDQEVVLGVRRGGKNVKVKIAATASDVPGMRRPDMERPMIEVAPQKEARDDEVLKELRGMRGVMEEMLMELKKQSPTTRRVPPRPRQ